MAKLLMVLRQPEEGFEEVEDVVHLLKLMQKTLNFYFSWGEVSLYVGRWQMPEDEFDSEFYCVLELEEGEDPEEIDWEKVIR